MPRSESSYFVFSTVAFATLYVLPHDQKKTREQNSLVHIDTVSTAFRGIPVEYRFLSFPVYDEFRNRMESSNLGGIVVSSVIRHRTLNCDI